MWLFGSLDSAGEWVGLNKALKSLSIAVRALLAEFYVSSGQFSCLIWDVAGLMKGRDTILTEH